MQTDIQYFPLPAGFILLLALLLALLFLLTVFRVLRYTYSRIGISPRYFFAILVLTLLGSYINIPLALFPSHPVIHHSHLVSAFGVPYVVPYMPGRSGTILAINVGGGLIPILISTYLTLKNGIYSQALKGIVIVGAVCYFMATPVEGVGIAISLFYPVVLTTVVALVLSRDRAAPLAYVCGTMGTLIGADLLNLGLLTGLKAPVLSIGGAGTFDAIFVTSLVAGLLASIGMKRTRT